jgi:hypothetical protein
MRRCLRFEGAAGTVTEGGLVVALTLFESADSRGVVRPDLVVGRRCGEPVSW